STLREDGDIRTGELIPSHLAILRQGGMLEAAKLAAAARGDVTAIGGREIPIFYAESWALIHALHAAGGAGARRYIMPPFEAIGEDALPGLVSQLPGYLRRPVNGWKTGERAVPMGPVQDEPVTQQRAALVVIDIALRVGSIKYAQALLGSATATDPDDPDLLHEAGILALVLHDETGAREKFTRAIANRNAHAQSFFELALLERDALGPNAERVRELLAEAVGRNPKHAEAMYLLGQLEESQGRPAKAVEWFEGAVKVLPRQSRMWYALALARHEEGQVVASRAAAQQALATAETEQEREQAKAALELLQDALTIPNRSPEKKPAQTVPEAWRQATGDAVVQGELRELVCGKGVSARMRVWVGGSWQELTLDDRTQATGRAMELQCGVQKPPVAVEVSFDAKSQRAVSIDFR
ncbi:MAG: tetratricopeptide repeat protein, partial [Acidobacteriota bacterium]